MKSSLLPVSLSHTVISNTPPVSSYRWRSNCSLHCGLRVFGTVCTHMNYCKRGLNLKSLSSKLIRDWTEVSAGTPCSCTSGVPVWTWRRGRSGRWGPWESGSGLRWARCWRFLSTAGLSCAALRDALTAAAGPHTDTNPQYYFPHVRKTKRSTLSLALHVSAWSEWWWFDLSLQFPAFLM